MKRTPANLAKNGTNCPNEHLEACPKLLTHSLDNQIHGGDKGGIVNSPNWIHFDEF